MATTFRVVIATDEPRYAGQAAAAAFAELDAIESRLSRFAEGSDLFRINRLRRGEATLVHLDTFECLRIALEVQAETGGAFDVAYASLPKVSHLREGIQRRHFAQYPPEGVKPSGGAGVKPAGGAFALDEAGHTVRVLGEGVRLDLGGIGKGFALDRMAALLREWEITSALLCASTSTLLALDPPPGDEGWPVEFGSDEAPQRLHLANGAFSASGIGVKGSHIIDPRTGRPVNVTSRGCETRGRPTPRTGRPAEGCFRAWAAAPTGALADALSTAFLVMGEDEIRAYCRHRPEVSAYVLPSPEAELRALK
jgi:thiamine biosynthesis lipoprotein